MTIDDDPMATMEKIAAGARNFLRRYHPSRQLIACGVSMKSLVDSDMGIVNYRSKLWTREKAGEVMGDLVSYVDILIANEEDAKDVFGIEAEGTDIISGRLNKEGYVSVAEQLTRQFGCKAVAITLRGSVSASENNWAGMLYANDKAYFSKNYLIRLVDRVGGGDSFSGGLIHAMLKGLGPQDVTEFAAAASCLKQTIEHDFNLVSEADVLALMGGNGSGRVQR